MRTSVWVGEGGYYSETNVLFLFVLHLSIKKVNVNLIQKLCYIERGIPWKEYNILWTTRPRIYLLCASCEDWDERIRQLGLALCATRIWGSCFLVIPNIPWQRAVCSSATQNHNVLSLGDAFRNSFGLGVRNRQPNCWFSRAPSTWKFAFCDSPHSPWCLRTIWN